MNRQKFMDDLIDAGASDDEIVEAMQLGKERGLYTDDPTPAPKAEPVDTRTDAQYLQDAVRPKSTWLSRLSGKLDESAEAGEARVASGDNPVTSGIRSAVESFTNIPRTAPGVRKVYEKGDEVVNAVISGLTEAADEYDTEGARFLDRPLVSILKGGAGKAYQGLRRLPQPAKDVIATGVNLLDFIPGTGAVAKAPGRVLDATESAGRGLLKAGKAVKLSETKIPKSVAKSAYGKTLLDKANGIIETMAEFGLTEGDNAASALIAKTKIQERADAVDEIIRGVAQQGNAPQVTPIHVALKGLKVKELANTGGRPEARNALKKIILDMVDDGHDQPVGIDQLIEAKKNLNRTGDLFSNGPATPEAIASRELRRKMYLNLTDEIGRLSPEAKALNVEIKKLLDAQAALDAAAYRESGKDIFGLTDHIIGGAALSNPGALWAAVPMAMAKQSIKGGRLGNTLIRGGKKLLGEGDRTISQTLQEVSAAKPREFTPEVPISASLPKGSSTPAFFREGYRPKTVTPITEPSRLIERTPFQIPPRSEMYPEVKKPVPTLGEKYRALGEPGTPSTGLPDLPPAATYEEVIQRGADRLRVTPEKYERILNDAKELEAAVRRHEITAEAAEAAKRESERYLEQLKKKPAISIDRLRALKEFRESRPPQSPGR